MELKALFNLDIGQRLGQLRAAPVSLGAGKPKAFLIVYGADFDVDPFIEMFFFPTDTLKLAVVTEFGELLWKRDLGRGIIPGMWFTPFFPFDLDGDGIDEIYWVNNTSPEHPLSFNNRVLQRTNALTGEDTGTWPWRNRQRVDLGAQWMGMLYRDFIMGGYVRGERVLVTANGTYGDMYLRGWNADMSLRWEYFIGKEAPGARGSHMCPVVDINSDGVDELLWGERCISLDTGVEIFCCDRDSYQGHSDIIQPVWLEKEKRWVIYTCRETPGYAPRVVTYNADGTRLWGDVAEGHMDMGWVAHFGPESRPVAMSIAIGAKSCGPEGRFHADRAEYAWDVATGEPIALPFSVYRTIPIDLNGDGEHELVAGVAGGSGDLLNGKGEVIGSIGAGTVALVGRITDHPGEQLLAFYPDGRLCLWHDAEAKDAASFKERIARKSYQFNQRLGACGYNTAVICGL